MSTNYAFVKLLRFDEPIKSNDKSVDSVSSNSTTGTDASNKTVEIKRSSRLYRKRTLLDKAAIEDDVHLNVKKKKCMVKKPRSSKTNPSRPIVPQKDSKKPPKNPVLIPDSDLNKISDTVSSSTFVNNEIVVSRQNPLKTLQNKKTNPIKKNILVNNVNKDDASNECGKNEKPVPLKILKNKISKSTTSIKKSPVDYIDKDNISSELVKNYSFPSSKSSKNKSSKSNNGRKSFVVKITNKNNVSTGFKESDDLISPKILKNKLTKSSIKKSPTMNNVKNNEFEEKSDAYVSQKVRGRSSLKKGQLPNTNMDNIYNNEIDSKQTTNLVIVPDKLHNVQKPELSKDPNDNMMMLRSNNKPPKIKKKWSEEWSGDISLNNVLKSINDEQLGGSNIDLNSCSKTNKKVMKTHKSKNTNYKKVKTKMLEKLDENTDDSFSSKSPNTSVHIDISNTNIHETQNPHRLLTTNSIPCTESRYVSNDIITGPNSNTIITDMPIVYDETKSLNTLSSSAVTTEPITTCTELSTPCINKPTTCIESSNNVISYENDQPSQLIFDSSSSSFPMGYSESAEISYGIAILSEAISRQCRESNEENVKIKSSEQDIDATQSSPKKSNSSSRSQVPSAMVSPQRVNEHRNKSKKVAKYLSECPEQNLSVPTDLQSRAEREILLISKRFNIPIETLRKTVIEEPLAVFRKKYSESISPSMITISPIVKKVETKTKPSTNYLSGNLDVEYKVEPIREAAAYEKTNLKDLMQELTKSMPSWSLSIVTNPARYVISNMTINTYGVPFANKVIVLDKLFRASVYINQSLEHTYCKPYTTAAEIVNLIKELDSI